MQGGGKRREQNLIGLALHHGAEAPARVMDVVGVLGERRHFVVPWAEHVLIAQPPGREAGRLEQLDQAVVFRVTERHAVRMVGER